VFGRDMVVPINVVADCGGQLNNNTKKKWLVIIKRENASRISHAYKVGD
jgi:hypothetical protein